MLPRLQRVSIRLKNLEILMAFDTQMLPPRHVAMGLRAPIHLKDLEEKIARTFSPHHPHQLLKYYDECPGIRVQLGRGHPQVAQHQALKSGKGGQTLISRRTLVYMVNFSVEGTTTTCSSSAAPSTLHL